MASLVLYADYAPVAELIFLALTYVIWSEVEATPDSWGGLAAALGPRAQALARALVGARSADLPGLQVQGGSQADPRDLGALRVFGEAVSSSGFSRCRSRSWVCSRCLGEGPRSRKLPPFLPGSHGSDVNWMWQPPSLERLREFFWSGQGYDFWATLREPSLSLSAVLGPFLLVPLFGFLLWRMEAFDRVPWRRLDRSVDRARLFALIWLCAVIAAISSLAAINYTFRIRYGILPMVPVALLLAWCLGLVSESWSKEISGMAKKLPDWALTALAVLFGVQCLLNLGRSARYRHDMGQVMVAVDQVYEEVAEHHAADRLTLLPDFRPYDYRPNAPRLFAEKTVLGDGVDLVKKGYLAGATSVISWTPSLWDRLEVTGRFSGCRSTTLFDWVYPCARGTGTWLMRFIASDRGLRQRRGASGPRGISMAPSGCTKALSRVTR